MQAVLRKIQADLSWLILITVFRVIDMSLLQAMISSNYVEILFFFPSAIKLRTPAAGSIITLE